MAIPVVLSTFPNFPNCMHFIVILLKLSMFKIFKIYFITINLPCFLLEVHSEYFTSQLYRYYLLSFETILGDINLFH